MKTLCIDAGHGGIDPGAVVNGYLEKELNLIVARRVFTILKEKGIDAELTRDSDISLSSSKRTDLIRNKYKYWNKPQGRFCWFNVAKKLAI